MTPCWSTESLRAKRTGGRGDAIEAKAGGERYSSRGLLLLRLRAGRPIPIVILGLVLGAEKGSDINVSRALAPAGFKYRILVWRYSILNAMYETIELVGDDAAA